ncbi:uncharacterized protein LOC8267269 isoform X2 [Ricinus communis]|uniref:uncharacterized protein LOC8267269 isoform X2 n=1 Tax=Ricinus communis TaxID=3988 RepID=UPI000D69C994|nr:uncharacterized protein LOC8267269 isoform X2 [Ricinus communis]|eukprot:XP_025013705.1 uncharacterized protein LOC8267269 isoform X2 [Ricinus communis]
MSREWRLSNLCHLEPDVIYLTKDKEEDLLIVLSQLFREIQTIKRELDCDSDEEDKKLWGGLELHHEDHNCLIKILADLVTLLTVESQFVPHLVGNILLVVSEFVAASGSEWNSFIHSLFICLELAISNVLSHTLPPSTNGAGYSKYDSSSFVVLKSRLVNANWSAAAAIIRVLRNILKYLKQEADDELREAYFGSVHSFLSNVPCDFMDEIQVSQSSETKESDAQNNHFMDALFLKNVGEQQKKIVFLGNFIQLLCSLVEQSCDVEVKVGSQDHHPVLCLITSFVPKVVSCCLGGQGNCVSASVSQYFRHKLLMLMLRLSYQTCLDYFTLISWLQLLHDYFEVLLWKPIIKLEFPQDESLEDSPFLSSLSDGDIHGINSHHLQRWAILLFLRCCFGLISLTRDKSKKCTCGTLNCCSGYSISDMDCCGRKKGFLEIYKWLQGHFPIDMSVGQEMYFEKCIGFTFSFLQLYMHEDDVLFKVLLQLLSINSCLEQLLNRVKWTSEDVKEDILFHISHIFNPVYLFHLFLAELHYDHQVLLDYLISKDIGISCAEYLLRCLRTVCSSWHLFMKFSTYEKVINHSFCKRRKIFLEASNLQVETSSVPIKFAPSSLEEKGKKKFEYCHNDCKTRRKLFKKAKDCLLSLKDSVENLQRKNLFPYNPEVLLKRLKKFEELCLDQETHGFL